jgi:hypothetical protein
VQYLSERVAEEYKARLVNCSEDEATELFARFATPELAAFTYRQNQNARVRELAWRTLEQMQAAGDPFAADLVAELQATRGDFLKPSQSFRHERTRSESPKDRGPDLER